MRLRREPVSDHLYIQMLTCLAYELAVPVVERMMCRWFYPMFVTLPVSLLLNGAPACALIPVEFMERNGVPETPVLVLRMAISPVVMGLMLAEVAATPVSKSDAVRPTVRGVKLAAALLSN